MSREETISLAVVGAGPAGLTAARVAADGGASVHLFESQATVGRKLLLTGGGRCNLTHEAPVRELLAAYHPADRFLRHALHTTPPAAVRRFFHDHGIATTCDAEGNVFPERHRAVDIRDLLVDLAARAGVRIHCNHPVFTVHRNRDHFHLVTSQARWRCRRLILTTGGLSYPQTGSTGDGFRWLRRLGHPVVLPRAALVPLITASSWPRGLGGVTVASVVVQVDTAGRRHRIQGPLVFTDRGLGGPAVLQVSRLITDALPNEASPVPIQLDLVPHESVEQIRQDWMETCRQHPKRGAGSLLRRFVPRRLAARLCQTCHIPDDLPICQLSRQQRERLIQSLKSVIVPIAATGPIEQATVTRGGADLAALNPKTCESMVCPGLAVAGELLNADGPCGGYNLQICWSTGTLAGMAAAGTLSTSSRKPRSALDPTRNPADR